MKNPIKSAAALFCLLLLYLLPCRGQDHLVPVTEPRPFPDVFPRSKAPAEDLSMCDLQREPADRRLMFVTLQGIVNRTRSEIYCLLGPTDQQWLDWILRKKWVNSAVVKDNDELLQRYPPVIRLSVPVCRPGI
jgi:hypothetical protein